MANTDKFHLKDSTPGHDAESNSLRLNGYGHLVDKRNEQCIDTVSMYKEAAEEGSTLGALTGATVGTVGGAELADLFTDSATGKIIGALVGGGIGGYAGYRMGKEMDTNIQDGVSQFSKNRKRNIGIALGLTGGALGYGATRHIFGKSRATSAIIGALTGAGLGYVGYSSDAKDAPSNDERKKELTNIHKALRGSTLTLKQSKRRMDWFNTKGTDGRTPAEEAYAKYKDTAAKNNVSDQDLQDAIQKLYFYQGEFGHNPGIGKRYRGNWYQKFVGNKWLPFGTDYSRLDGSYDYVKIEDPKDWIRLASGVEGDTQDDRKKLVNTWKKMGIPTTEMPFGWTERNALSDTFGTADMRGFLAGDIVSAVAGTSMAYDAFRSSKNLKNSLKAWGIGADPAKLAGDPKALKRYTVAKLVGEAQMNNIMNPYDVFGHPLVKNTPTTHADIIDTMRNMTEFKDLPQKYFEDLKKDVEKIRNPNDVDAIIKRVSNDSLTARRDKAVRRYDLVVNSGVATPGSGGAPSNEVVIEYKTKGGGKKSIRYTYDAIGGEWKEKGVPVTDPAISVALDVKTGRINPSVAPGGAVISPVAIGRQIARTTATNPQASSNAYEMLEYKGKQYVLKRTTRRNIYYDVDYVTDSSGKRHMRLIENKNLPSNITSKFDTDITTRRYRNLKFRNTVAGLTMTAVKIGGVPLINLIFNKSIPLSEDPFTPEAIEAANVNGN